MEREGWDKRAFDGEGGAGRGKVFADEAWDGDKGWLESVGLVKGG